MLSPGIARCQSAEPERSENPRSLARGFQACETAWAAFRSSLAVSSRGLGRQVLNLKTRVRFPVPLPVILRVKFPRKI